MSEIVVPQTCVKRIVKDVKEIIKNPLTNQGIYYQHDEENMLTGHAIIIGPSETPYEDGFYFFKFNFPTNYPFSPPTVTYFTNDGLTRFNPNLYKSGKVCVSVLNTWRGEPWTSCQTISSILLVLCTLLSSNPIENEPGINSNHPDCKNYNDILTYKNIEVAICGMISKKYLNTEFIVFYPIITEFFIKNYDKTLDKLRNFKINKPYRFFTHTALYGMGFTIDYDVLIELMESCNALLKQT